MKEGSSNHTGVRIIPKGVWKIWDPAAVREHPSLPKALHLRKVPPILEFQVIAGLFLTYQGDWQGSEVCIGQSTHCHVHKLVKPGKQWITAKIPYLNS